MKYEKILIEGAKSFGIELSREQVEQFSIFYRLLVEWNEKMNLTTITEEKEVVVKHFLDCLSGAPVLQSFEKPLIADVGTGAGFPGIPLKIIYHELSFVLIDCLKKRLGFLAEVVKELGMEHIELVHGRAEELAHTEAYRERFDIVVSRAVASLPVLMEYSMGYVKKGGILLAYKGPTLAEELKASERALSVLQSGVETTQTVEIPFSEYSHTIAVIRKKAALPTMYPRSQAKIKKQPL